MDHFQIKMFDWTWGYQWITYQTKPPFEVAWCLGFPRGSLSVFLGPLRSVCTTMISAIVSRIIWAYIPHDGRCYCHSCTKISKITFSCTPEFCEFSLAVSFHQAGDWSCIGTISILVDQRTWTPIEHWAYWFFGCLQVYLVDAHFSGCIHILILF